jgi:hypothetical protein
MDGVRVICGTPPQSQEHLFPSNPMPDCREWSLVSPVCLALSLPLQEVKVEARKPRLRVDRTSVDFGVQTVIRANQIKASYTEVLG